MEHAFWHDKWANNEIGFHQPRPNGLLTGLLPGLVEDTAARVFVPLCGKTLDIGWLLQRGHQVVGAELSRTAIEQLFAELDIDPVITQHGALELFSGPSLDVWVGDIFEMTAEQLGPVKIIYDRAALVALPDEMRRRYADHLRALTSTAPQLLLTFEYDQTQIEGPPFSLPETLVRDCYGEAYTLTKLRTVEVPNGGLKGYIPAMAVAWELR
ncbi:MAG: thiopurine S-methyltransferase [Pseudomonadota bacterium]